MSGFRQDGFLDVEDDYNLCENFQNSSLLGTSNSPQLSLPVVSNAASLTGSVCNFSSISPSVVSSSWLLPSTSGTSFQPLMGSAYLYQHSSTAMLSGQSQVSTLAASYPGIFEWDIAGSTENSSSLRDFTVTVIDQDTAVSSMSMAASDANNMVPLYPSLSACHVQGTPSQIPNQGHSLSLPYQQGSQVYYYNQGTPGPLLSGELGPCLQSYGSVSYTGSRSSASQPEMVMVLKEVQPTNILPPASTSGIYYSASAQPISETSFQVMGTSLEQAPSQTFYLLQTPEFSKSCSSRKIIENNPPPELGGISGKATVQSSSNLLALPPAPSQEHPKNKNLDDIKTKFSKPLDAYQIPIENQDPPLLPLEIPDIHQLLACIDPIDQEKTQASSENADLGNNNLSLEDQGTLENGIDSNSDCVDTATLMEDIHLPYLFNSMKDLDQYKDLEVTKTNDTSTIKLNQVQEKSNVNNGASDQSRKNKHKASEPTEGTPKAKIQPKDPECFLGDEVIICNVSVNERAVNVAKHSNRKPQKATSNRVSKTKDHRHKQAKRTRENNSKKAEDNKQSGNKVKANEKPTIPKMKRKKNQPEFSQESFKKPRSCLGMHMLESVQVFHALGKKSDKKTGLSSSRALGNSSNPKESQSSLAVKSWLEIPHEGKVPQKTQGKAQKVDSGAEKECSSPSQYELPPPGKVKLVPLPFLTLDKPQTRPVPRRPQSLASHRSAVPYSAQPGSTNSAQPMAVNSSRRAPASLTGPSRPTQPISRNPTQPGLTNPTQPSVTQSAASRPAPYNTATCTSLQQEPVPTSVTKTQTPAKPQTQFLLQDFSCQPIPWRKPNVPEPVMSKPITKEQRPKREAMKRKAQQERENAAKYTSLGKLQFFIEREKEMEIARYYGYVM